MKKRSEVSGSTLLAASIFILWSFGIVFMPSVQAHVFISALTLMYLALHVVVFCIAAVLLGRELKKVARNKGGMAARAYVLLYVYVLATLAWSSYLVVHARYF